MKKLLLILLCFALPLVFVSCDNDDNTVSNLAGKMTMAINGTNYTYTGVGTYKEGGKLYVATMSGKNAVSIRLVGTNVGSYTLGVTNVTDVTDLAKIITGGVDIKKFENIMTFIPFDNAGDTYVVVAGECNITVASSSKIEGTFKGKAIKYQDISNLDISSIIKLIASGIDISGSFTAKETSEIISQFTK
ncbi:MAG: hypothetical protein ACTTJH_05510 [Bacteroidales bacterium]